MIKERTERNIFYNGALAPEFIAKNIAVHSSKKDIGAHSIFLGQVRNDVTNGKEVAAIAYSAYEPMVLETMHAIREDLFEKYQLTCMHVHHSLGKVMAGEICLFVFVSSRHRKAAIDACEELVERIKFELPIWGKEMFSDEAFQWKVNTVK